MHRAGLTHAVAPLGTALTEEQLALLWKMVAEPTLCFDGDSAGIKASYRALDLALPLLKPGHSLKFALLPEGLDPDDLLKAQGPDAVKAVVAAAEPLSDVIWRRALTENDRSTPERKAQFEKDLRVLVSQIGDENVRKHYMADLSQRFDELFQRNRSGGGFNARKPYGLQKPWKKGQKAWEMQSPASPQLKAMAASAGAAKALERREKLIVLSFINHPDLIHDFLDEFAAVEFSARELDSLRTQIINSAAAERGLDNSGLRSHLLSKGFGPELDRLENQATRLNEWFLGRSAAQDDARTGLRQMFALHRKTVMLVFELKAAEAAFVAEPTEENFIALSGLREELLSAVGSEALIAGFGAASGRVVDAIS